MIPHVKLLDDELHRGDAFHRELQELDRPYAVTLTEGLTADDWQKLNALWRERLPNGGAVWLPSWPASRSRGLFHGCSR